MHITYTIDIRGVDWDALKAAVADDDFDNGRTLEQMRLSAENSAVNVFAYAGDEIVGNARRMMELISERVPSQHIHLAAGENVEAFYAKLGFTRWNVGMGRVVGQ